MADNQSTTGFVYESSRHKALMDEYSRLSTDEQYLDWAKKAPLVAAYMGMTISRVRMAIAQERARLDLEKNKKQQQNIKLGG